MMNIAKEMDTMQTTRDPYWAGWEMYARGEMPPFEDAELMCGYKAAKRGHAAWDTISAGMEIGYDEREIELAAEQDARREVEFLSLTGTPAGL